MTLADAAAFGIQEEKGDAHFTAGKPAATPIHAEAH